VVHPLSTFYDLSICSVRHISSSALKKPVLNPVQLSFPKFPERRNRMCMEKSARDRSTGIEKQMPVFA
jgi:hypothetical protein